MTKNYDRDTLLVMLVNHPQVQDAIVKLRGKHGINENGIKGQCIKGISRKKPLLDNSEQIKEYQSFEDDYQLIISKVPKVTEDRELEKMFRYYILFNEFLPAKINVGISFTESYMYIRTDIAPLSTSDLDYIKKLQNEFLEHRFGISSQSKLQRIREDKESDFSRYWSHRREYPNASDRELFITMAKEDFKKTDRKRWEHFKRTRVDSLKTTVSDLKRKYKNMLGIEDECGEGL